MFERFSSSAREAVVAARSEARELRHQFVGTEHLLLGLLDTPTGVSTGPAAPGIAAKVLAASGVDAAYVRSQVTRLVGSGADGLGEEEEAAALLAIGIDLDAVRSRLEESFGEGVLDQPQTEPFAGRTPLTARARKVLGLAAREARQFHCDSIESEHILLGLIREGAGVAALILATKAPLVTFRERVLSALERAA